MKVVVSAFSVLFVLTLFAEKQPFERYQSIVDRQMFGQPPVGFDPTKPPSEVSKTDVRELTKEQEVLKSSIHFSVINVTPEGATAVGFSDTSDPKAPVHYYLKVGEERNGWKVLEADPVKATMHIAKGEIDVSLELGANSAKGGAPAARAGQLAAAGIGAGARTGLLGGLRRTSLGGGAGASASSPTTGLGSLRERRAAREAERVERAKAMAEAEAKEKEEKAVREAEREEQRSELQKLKEELAAQREAAAARDAAEKEKAAREAQQQAANQAEANAENDD